MNWGYLCVKKRKGRLRLKDSLNCKVHVKEDESSLIPCDEVKYTILFSMAANKRKSDRVQERVASSKLKMLKSLEKYLGIVTDAAKAARISRETHYRWMKEDEVYRNQVIEIREVSTDFVEKSMFDQIRKGDSALIKFYMSTQGRNRGYTLKQDHEHRVTVSNENIEWRITSPGRVQKNGEVVGSSNGHNSK